MSVTAAASLKRKRDWSSTRDDDAGASLDLSSTSIQSTSEPSSKRTKCISAYTVPHPISTSSSATTFTFELKLKSLSTPISSCRLDRRSRLSESVSSLEEEECVDLVDREITSTEAGPSSISDLQHSLVACSIDPEYQCPSKRTSEAYGFDTTLSNIQFGYSKSSHYRFTSPLSPEPEKRKRVKSRRHRNKSSSLLKSTLHRNHVISLRKRFPAIFAPRSPPRLDSVPPLDDDDEFDDDEDDEVIDDFDSDSQVDAIVDLYSRESTPEPEEVQIPTDSPIPDKLQCSPPPVVKPKPLQPSSRLNIPVELARTPLPIYCVVSA